MKPEDIQNRNWKEEDDTIYVVTSKIVQPDNVVVPDAISTEHYLNHPSYYQYICNDIFLTMDEAKEHFYERCMRVRSAIKRKIANKLDKISRIEGEIQALEKLNQQIKEQYVLTL